MDPAAVGVTAVGLALVAAVNVYFLRPRRAAMVRGPGVQEVQIRVASGYDPSVVEVEAGRPVRLVFRREEVEGCSDTVIIPEWKIVQRLPTGQDTAVEFTPARAGEYEFTCGMHMLRGTIRVR